MLNIPFENSYAKLPRRFYAMVSPTPVTKPEPVLFNARLALELGLSPEATETSDGVEIFAGNSVPTRTQPLAMAYAGHQFAHWVPQLGDGRAILLGELSDQSGQRLDVQLKGAGITPFSRQGDGRAAIGPVLREYIVSEAMAALGVPTTRAMYAISSGDSVIRERLLPGAILTRVARSHIRVGTFQYFLGKNDIEAIRILADYAIKRLYPHCESDADRYMSFLRAVALNQAALIARWQLLGFIHGVMNTDNASVSGETIDYGPCAFMEAFDPNTVFSSIDHQGRYAWCNQPAVGQWNVAQLCTAFIPLFDDRDAAMEEMKDVLDMYANHYQRCYWDIMADKIGLSEMTAEDHNLVQELLDCMFTASADFTLTFRRLGDALKQQRDEVVLALFNSPARMQRWLQRWRLRIHQQADDLNTVCHRMHSSNPVCIPRNHKVEEAIVAAEAGDYAVCRRLLQAVTHPREERDADYIQPARPDQRVQRTFCGT